MDPLSSLGFSWTNLETALYSWGQQDPRSCPLTFSCTPQTFTHVPDLVAQARGQQGEKKQQQGPSGGLGAQHRLHAVTCAGAWQGCRRQGWSGGAAAPAQPPVPWGHPSPLTPALSAGRSLDRLDSVEILLPPKFPTWEEEYNQISESVNESSCINQVSRGVLSPAAPAWPREKGGLLRGGRNIFFPLQNKTLTVLQELHMLFSGSFTKVSRPAP